MVDFAQAASGANGTRIGSDDPLETRSPSDRRAAQFQRLRSVVQDAKSQAYYAETLRNVDPEALQRGKDLEKLPILRKSDLIDIQSAMPPFGGIMRGDGQADYLFVSPGPIHEPGFFSGDFWRVERAMKAAGFSADDIVHNTFSYHLTPGAWILDAGARALGCSIIPAGNAPIDLQLLAISQYKASAYCGTPDFLKTLVEAYQKTNHDHAPFSKALVTGGALTPGLRTFFEQSNIDVLQCYATAELGLISYETSPNGLMVVDEDIIVEIVDPYTGEAMPFGEVGEVVVTTLRSEYPLIRFGTGDLSSFVVNDQADNRTGDVLSGWLGRSDEATKVRGMFIRPTQIQALCAHIEGLDRARLVVDRHNEKDDIILFCEMADAFVNEDNSVQQGVLADAFRAQCHLKCNINIVPKGTIPDDGKLIVDLR